MEGEADDITHQGIAAKWIRPLASPWEVYATATDADHGSIGNRNMWGMNFQNSLEIIHWHRIYKH